MTRSVGNIPRRKRSWLAIHMGLATVAVTALKAASTGDKICKSITDNHDNYFITHDTTTGDFPCMVVGAGGNYSYKWKDVGTFVGGKGWTTGTSNRKVGYNAGVFAPSGNGYLSLYGWTRSENELVEYYVVDSWGDFRPPDNNAGTKGVEWGGQVTSDGGTYDLYRVEVKKKPSIDGETDFVQYWSVRTEPRAIKQDQVITFEKHVNGWAGNNWNLGAHAYQVMATEGNGSSGSSNVTVWETS